MLNYFSEISPMMGALYASFFTWIATALGSSLVLFLKKINKNILDAMLGFAGGIMISSSFFSLLIPAITIAENLKLNVLIIIVTGFLTGCLFLFIFDTIINIKIKHKKNKNIKRCILLIISITIHNILEGIIIGVAFGSTINNTQGITIISAIIISFGISIQNFTEGSAVSIQLRKEGYSKFKSFFIGQISGIAEPISAVFGIILVMKINKLLPFLLSFAAGAIIFVVIIELIPESQKNKYKGLITITTILGFIVMMSLDIWLN